MSMNKTAGDEQMDSFTIHHSPEGLVLETDKRSVLIGEKDIPLLVRGQARPIRDMDHKTLGTSNYAFTRAGNLVLHLGSEMLSIPARVWLDRSGIKRVIVT